MTVVLKKLTWVRKSLGRKLLTVGVNNELPRSAPFEEDEEDGGNAAEVQNCEAAALCLNGGRRRQNKDPVNRW